MLKDLRRSDNLFFSAVMLLMAVTVFIGFAHSYFLAGMVRAKLPSPLVHVHGALFSLWVVLILTQVWLVAAKRVKWHMQLGIFGVFLAASMVIVGLATVVMAEKRNFAPPAIFTYDLMSILLFGVLVGWGYVARRDAGSHKRLMMLATLAIMAQALSRWPYAFLDSDLVFFSLLNLPLGLLVLYDLLTLRRLEVATLIGGVLLGALQLTYKPISQTAAVQSLIAHLQKS